MNSAHNHNYTVKTLISRSEIIGVQLISNIIDHLENMLALLNINVDMIKTSLMNKYTLLLSLYLLPFSITFAQTNKIDSSEIVNLRIDPETARGAAVSDVFEDVKFIPLETTSESLFGRIQQLGITKDYFIIYDGDTKAILIFSKEGKYKTKIDANRISLGDDSGGASEFNGFELKRENDADIIQIRASKNYVDFDLNGKLIKKVALTPAQSSYYFANYTVGDDMVSIKFNRPTVKGSDTYHELVLAKGDDVVGRYLPFLRSIKYRDNIGRFGSNIFNYGKKDELYYVGWAGDLNIYKIKPAGVLLSYHFILPEKYSLPLDFDSNPEYIGNKQLYFKNNREKYFQIGNAFQFGNNLFFNLMNSSSGNKSFLYNLKKSLLLSIRNLQPDQLSSFLPVTDATFDYYGFHLFKDGYLYNSYSSLSMFNFKQDSENKSAKYSKLLQEYFSSQNKKGNPVLIMLKPKLN